MKKLLVLSLTIALTSLSQLSADLIKIKDGSTLKGKILKIEDGKIILETKYAGTLEIEKSKVDGFETDKPVFVRLSSGNTMSGSVSLKSSGEMEIKNDDGTMVTKTSKVKASWRPGSKDPAILKLEAEAKANERKWVYTAGVDINGKSGNTDQQNVGVNLKAVLKSPNDSLKFYMKTAMAEKNGDKTEDETLGGVNYTSYFDKKIGWFIRSELENDKFENISFRSTTAGGLSYRFLTDKKHTLAGRAGIGYLFEDYTDGTEKKTPSMDFGLDHMYQFKDDWKIDTELSLIPGIESFGEYLFFQDTGFVIPLAGSDHWKLRLGLANTYNSEPAKGKTELDTTYYTRFVLEFD